MVGLSKKEEFEEYEKGYLARTSGDNAEENTTDEFFCDECGGEEEHDEECTVNLSNTVKHSTPTSSIFKRIDFNFKSKLETIVEIDYINLMDVRERLFFSKRKNPLLYSRDYIRKSKNNFIHFKIETSRAKNTKWSYGSDREIGDNFENGYSLIISFQRSEQTVRKALIKMLQHYKFGCFPSSHSILAHHDSKYPTESEAAKILNSITKSFVGNDFERCYKDVIKDKRQAKTDRETKEKNMMSQKDFQRLIDADEDRKDVGFHG
jgi:hypothetical protein